MDPLTLGRLSEALRLEQEMVATPSIWRDSPFRWMQRLPNLPKHASAKALLVAVLAHEGIDARPETKNGASYLVCDSRRLSLKVSFLWSQGNYLFQQIRISSAFSHVVLFGISPRRAHLWIVPTTERALFQSRQHISGDGLAANYLLRIDPDAPPTWLDCFGGTLSDGVRVLRASAVKHPRRIRRARVNPG
jgi:hypothetical protein